MAASRSADPFCPFMTLCSDAAISLTLCYATEPQSHGGKEKKRLPLFSFFSALCLCASVAISLSCPHLADHLQQGQVNRHQDRDHDAGHKQQDHRLDETGQLPELRFGLRVVEPGDLVEHLAQRP